MPFADRFTRIDELTRPDHVWLTEDDACLFLGEYTAREGYAYSVTNNLNSQLQEITGSPRKTRVAAQGARHRTGGRRLPPRARRRTPAADARSRAAVQGAR